MKLLADLPNTVGFEFTGITKDDRKVACKVILATEGYHTTDYPFKELKRWM